MSNYIYIWQGGDCKECAKMNGKEFYDEKDISPIPPLHPNCDCYIAVLEINNNGKVMSTNQNFRKALEKTLQSEDAFTQNTGRKDQPTNMGIKQGTLDNYNLRHPNFNFPGNVDKLNQEQAEQIYKTDYWDNLRFDEIKNNRIRDSLFDIGVMSGYGNMAKQIQEALNNFGIKISIDKVMGNQTIGALNNIPNNQINNFMDVLKENRMRHLQNDDPQKWQENKNGWTSRTMKY